MVLLLGVGIGLQAQPKAATHVFPPLRLKNYDQMTTIGEAHLRVSYALNADDLSDASTYVDLQYLQVGDSIAKYYSAFLSNKEYLVNKWIKEHPQAASVPRWLGEGGKRDDCWSEYQYSEIFKEGNEIVIYLRMPRGFRTNYWYRETYPQQEWTIQSDTSTICGYVCQKAVCTFCGRSFEAWFSPDIPVGMGPWKFGGLPGLILKLYDKDRLYRFECVNIEQGRFPVTKYDYSQYKEEERTRLLKLQRKINEDYKNLIGIKSTDLRTGQPVVNMPLPYEPLELE